MVNADIDVYEADVDLLRRFIVDSNLPIDPIDNALHYDIEMDDTIRDFEDMIFNARITSLSAKDNKGNKYSYVTSKNTDIEQYRLLIWFLNIMQVYPVLEAFNGNKFDHKIIRRRFETLIDKLKITPKLREELEIDDNTYQSLINLDFRHWAWQDSYVLFEKYFQGESNVKQSLSLDNLGEKLLGKNKIKVEGKFIDLYHKDKNQLLEYNKMDVEIQAGLEEKYGYCSLERQINAISGSFLVEHYPSNKIDILALKFAQKEGHHIISKITKSNRKEPTRDYEGTSSTR